MQEILYNRIGDTYNSTRVADTYIAERIYALLSPHRDSRYLDIGCGTGNYTIALQEKGLNLTGLEPSVKMLDVAKSRNSAIGWVCGRAEEMPFADNSFDGVFGTLTLHHWTNLGTAFKEIHRVLKENGAIVLFTSTAEQMQGYWLNHYFPNMLQRSIEQMPSLERIHEALHNAGLQLMTAEKYFIQDDLQDHFLYVGKNKPELYFDEKIRRGISSFAALANETEVRSGLLKLAADLHNGDFASVKKQYGDAPDDYLFIRAKKSVST